MPIQFTRKGRFRLSRDGVSISEHNVIEEAYENALEHAEANGDGVYRVDPPWTEVDVPIITISRGPRAPADTSPDVPPPSAPGSPSAVTQSSTTIRVSWSASVGAVSYNIYLATVTGGPYNFYVSVQTLTHDVTGLTPATAYFFKITAVDAFGNETQLASCTEVSDTTSAGAGGGNPDTLYTPTHYVAPFASVAGAANDYADLGATSWTNAANSGTPTTLGTAMARATAGNKVRCAPGAYIGQNTTARWQASFAPANSGTVGNHIIFYAQYPAAYNSTSPTLLSEIRRTLAGGGAALSTQNGSADPGEDYVVFDGFYLDESATLSGTSNGAFALAGLSDNCQFRRIWCDRAEVAPYGGGYNGSAMYITSTTNCRIVDCLFTGTSTLSTNQDSAIEIYNSEDLTMEHLEFTNAGNAIHVKTEAPTDSGLMDDVIIRYNKMVGHGGVVTQSSRGTFIYQNLIISTNGSGIRWTNIAANVLSADPNFTTQVQAYNNTVLRSGALGPGAWNVQGAIKIAAGTEIYNNIFRDTSGNSTNLVDMPTDGSSWAYDSPESFDRMDYNFYVDTAPRFRLHNSVSLATHTTFAAYQSAMAAGFGLDAYGFEHESHSQHGTVTFTNEAGGDYTLANNGQAALTASVTGGKVGCYITGTEEIGLRASPTY